MTKPIAKVVDPNSGEELTLSDIAKRYGLRKNTVRARYRHGKRGQALIEQPVSGNISDDIRVKIAQADLIQYIEQAKRTPLAMPLKHIASASKMVGGAV